MGKGGCIDTIATAHPHTRNALNDYRSLSDLTLLAAKWLEHHGALVAIAAL